MLFRPKLKIKQLDSNNSFASDKTKGPKYIPLSEEVTNQTQLHGL